MGDDMQNWIYYSEGTRTVSTLHLPRSMSPCEFVSPPLLDIYDSFTSLSEPSYCALTSIRIPKRRVIERQRFME